MKLGLIGYPLGHSWSPQIHGLLTGEAYELWPLQEEELEEFFAKKDFDGINVTIPYKKRVMQYLDEIDPAAERIGAVNCIVNRNGKLTGYNTDCPGLIGMMVKNGIDVAGKKVAILGSGGASAAAYEAVKEQQGIPYIVSRKKRDGILDYEELYEKEAIFSVLINATPIGMTPHTDAMPADLSRFSNLEALVDIVANPLMTHLRFEAKCRGLKTCGGFEMLVRQAYVADEYFFGKEPGEERIEACMKELYHRNRNIVLTGMPTCGKTTLGEELARCTGREMVDLDAEIEKKLGISISECFAEKGETYFRDVESQVCREMRERKGLIIACGGGVIKRKENMVNLNENGQIFWVRRNTLYSTESRPLTGSDEILKKLYEERKGLYEMYSDVIVSNNGTIEEALEEILRREGEN